MHLRLGIDPLGPAGSTKAPAARSALLLLVVEERLVGGLSAGQGRIEILASDRVHDRLTDDLPSLRHLDDQRTIMTNTVVGGSFGQASYRLSLLALIGETNIGPELAPLADLPLTLQWGDDMQAVGRGEVAWISAGRILPQENNDESPA